MTTKKKMKLITVWFTAFNSLGEKHHITDVTDSNGKGEREFVEDDFKHVRAKLYRLCSSVVIHKYKEYELEILSEKEVLLNEAFVPAHKGDHK